MLDQWQPCRSVLTLAPKCIYECVIRTTEFIIRMKKCFDQNENNVNEILLIRTQIFLLERIFLSWNERIRSE